MKVPKLLANVECGEGNIKMPDDWNQHHFLLRADILKDWIGLLGQEYDKTLEDWKKESASTKAKIKKEKYESAKINSR